MTKIIIRVKDLEGTALIKGAETLPFPMMAGTQEFEAKGAKIGDKDFDADSRQRVVCVGRSGGGYVDIAGPDNGREEKRRSIAAVVWTILKDTIVDVIDRLNNGKSATTAQHVYDVSLIANSSFTMFHCDELH